jgi:DNA-binding FadR family transcriptional regulator
MIGVSRESVNKLLRDWQRRGWVKLQRGGLIVVSHKAVGELVASPD